MINEIKEWFDYDPNRGILLRKRSVRCNAPIEISYRNSIPFKGKYYRYSILCWVVYYARFPNGLVDHKDRDSSNNRIENLREVTPTQNQYNKAGYGKFPKGVTWRSRKKKPWIAKIRVDGTRINLGSFATCNEAEEAYKQASLKLHGEFSCLQKIR